MKNRSISEKSFFLFVAIVISAIAVVFYIRTKPFSPAKAEVALPETPGIPAVTTPSVQTSSMNSSKAGKKLVLETTTQSDGTTLNDVFVTDADGGNRIEIADKMLESGSVMSIPHNAWDPMDTYVFMEEKTGNSPRYYVYKADGEPFPSGTRFIDVGAVWGQKQPGYAIREATGWASGTLLIIYTAKDDGSRGPAFWFEIPSTAIIQLAG